MARPTANQPAGPQRAAGVEPPQLTLLNLFPTPLVIATMPNAEALNAELKSIILARERVSESVQRSNQGGWQSSWDLHEWGGAPMQKVLAFGRAVADEVTVDRAGKRHDLAWRVNCWANINRHGHGNQFHTHPGALWSATYYVDDGGVGADPSLGGEFEVQDPRGSFARPLAKPRRRHRRSSHGAASARGRSVVAGSSSGLGRSPDGASQISTGGEAGGAPPRRRPEGSRSGAHNT